MYNIQPPLFPETISDDDGVYSSVKVDGFAGLQIRNGMYGDLSSSERADGIVHFHWDKELTREQFSRTIEFICKNGAVLLEKALKSFMDEYTERQEYWAEPDEFPEIQSPDDLKLQCGISAVYIRADFPDGRPSFGLEFGCTWEIEHGAGVSFIGLELIQSGQAEDAFTEPYYDSKTGEPLREPNTGKLLSELRQK